MSFRHLLCLETGMFISAPGKIEELPLNAKITGVEKPQCPSSSCPWCSLVSRVLPKCFQKRGHSPNLRLWALTKPEAVRVFLDSNNPCAAEARIGEPLPL